MTSHVHFVVNVLESISADLITKLSRSKNFWLGLARSDWGAMAAAVELEPEESPLDQLFSDLLCSTVETVAVCMTAESARRKCDWRALASVLGFSGRQVTLLQQDKREPCKGRQLVNVWEDLGKASLRKFIYALKEAHMEECYRTITQDPYLEGE